MASLENPVLDLRQTISCRLSNPGKCGVRSLPCAEGVGEGGQEPQLFTKQLWSHVPAPPTRPRDLLFVFLHLKQKDWIKCVSGPGWVHLETLGELHGSRQGGRPCGEVGGSQTSIAGEGAGAV